MESLTELAVYALEKNRHGNNYISHNAKIPELKAVNGYPVSMSISQISPGVIVRFCVPTYHSKQ